MIRPEDYETVVCICEAAMMRGAVLALQNLLSPQVFEGQPDRLATPPLIAKECQDLLAVILDAVVRAEVQGDGPPQPERPAGKTTVLDTGD